MDVAGGASRAGLVQASAPRDRAADAAQEFEATILGVFVNEMMKETTPEFGGGGHGEEMFRSLLGDAIGARLAEAGGIGLAASVEARLKAYRK